MSLNLSHFYYTVYWHGYKAREEEEACFEATAIKHPLGDIEHSIQGTLVDKQRCHIFQYRHLDTPQTT